MMATEHASCGRRKASPISGDLVSQATSLPKDRQTTGGAGKGGGGPT